MQTLPFSLLLSLCHSFSLSYMSTCSASNRVPCGSSAQRTDAKWWSCREKEKHRKRMRLHIYGVYTHTQSPSLSLSLSPTFSLSHISIHVQQAIWCRAEAQHKELTRNGGRADKKKKTERGCDYKYMVRIHTHTLSFFSSISHAISHRYVYMLNEQQGAVYMYMCIYMYVYIYIWIWIYICVYTYIYINIYIHVYIYIQRCIYIFTHICLCMYVYIWTYTYVKIYVYIYADIRIYI